MVMPVLQFFDSQIPEHPVHPFFGLFPRHHVIERGKHHILEHGGHKHLIIRILQHKSRLLPDFSQVFFADEKISGKDSSLPRKKAQRQLHDRGFSRPVGADKAHALSLPDPEGNISEHRISQLIGKTDILKFQHFLTP